MESHRRRYNPNATEVMMAKNENATPAAPAQPAPKSCPKCGTALVGGIKYTDICTKCEPFYLSRCGSCYHPYWDCICVRPHTWE